MRSYNFCFSLFPLTFKRVNFLKLSKSHSARFAGCLSNINEFALNQQSVVSNSMLKLRYYHSGNLLFKGESAMAKPRYRIYREHKYVSFVLSEFSRFVAKVDFTVNRSIEEIIEKFNDVKDLMHGHAEHENTHIHELLRKKQSNVYQETEADHASHNSIFRNLDQMLTKALALTDDELKIELGHKFYLGIQDFEGANLHHQFHEETVLMPELQRLYTDEEILREVDGPVYEMMSVEDMVGMMQVLFPHFNKNDREAFLKDIKQSQPEKFPQVLTGMMPSLDENEQAYFMSKFETSPGAIASKSVKSRL